MDFFCLTGGAIRAGYPSASLLRTLSATQRRRARGRVALLLTANRHYTLGAARPGKRLTRALARRLHVAKGVRLGANTWYVVPGAGANGVLRVRRGVIREVGTASRLLTRTPRAARRFFTGFR
jgi:hypothetical protein